jgi:hypothetical protein
MKIRWIVVPIIMLLAVTAFAQDTQALKIRKDKVNYAIGVNMVNNIKHQGIDIDLDLVIQGMKDAHSGGKLLLTDDELRKSISQYYDAMRQKQLKTKKNN